ncbi:S41 family peptidase [Tunturibacter psychrotolerans]|uniref:S41 family peptidase n=1 Tax=Tunturiibacter psychrotolerans TaxID=3069686 RepID=A0AAU7ZQR2_9BACT
MGESAGIRPDSASRMLALGAEFDARTGGEWLMLGQSSGGATRSWVPTLGSVVWVVWEPYYAYMFEMSAGQWVGYVRVSDYEYDRKAVKEFEKIIARFERETVAMIFDQIDNTGGSMFQMYALLSTLTDKALALPTHEIMISDDDAAVAASVVEDAKAGESVPTDERPSGELVAYSHLVLTE